MIKHKDQNSKCKDTVPVRIAVTGGIGSGKSMVCDFLKGKGLVVASADELSRQAVEPGTDAYGKIVDYFGEEVLLPDKTINRPEFRRIISKDPEAKKVLEGFIHPEVFRQMVKKIEIAAKNGQSVVVVEVPLLFETGFEVWFDYIVFVSVEKGRRIERLMSRDHISHEEAEAMMSMQMPENEKQKRSDFVIDNNETKEKTLISASRLYEHIIANITKKNENS